MVYYDRIAKQWHAITGTKGGALKKYVLNDLILSKVQHIAGKVILEIGAGNGYFIPMMLKRFSGQVPSQIIITDHSSVLLEIAKRRFRLLNAKYFTLDVRNRFPFTNREFDLILSTMVFNEIPKIGVQRALKECNRVLKNRGKMLVTVLHPKFINSLVKRDMIKRNRKGYLTMPSTKGLRLPIVKRNLSEYHDMLKQNGFQFIVDNVYPNKKVLNEKPGFRKAGNVPIALVISCEKNEDLNGV